FENLTYHADVSFVRDNERWADFTVDEEEEGELEPTVLVHFPTEIIQSDAQVDYLWREFSLTTLGLEVQEKSAHISQFNAAGEGNEEEPETTDIDVSRTNVAVFGQEQLKLLDGALHGVGGVRYDHYDDFGDHWTFSGSGTYLVAP